MKIIKKIISWILVFLSFLSLFLLTITFVVKINFNETKITNYLKETDFTFLLKTRNGEKTEIEKNVEEVLEKIGIPPSTITNVMNSEATKNFIGKYAYETFAFFLFNRPIPVISSDDFLQLFEDNFKVIEATLEENGQTFTEKQKKDIQKFIENHKEQIMDLFPEINKVIQKFEKKDIPIYGGITLLDVTNLLNFLISDTWLYCLIFANIIIFVLLLLLNFKTRLYLSYWRMSVILYTFFLIFIEIMLGTVVKTFVMTSWESANVFLNYLVNLLSKNLGLFLILGIVLIIFFSLLLKKFKIIEQKKCKESVNNIV